MRHQSSRWLHLLLEETLTLTLLLQLQSLWLRGVPPSYPLRRRRCLLPHPLLLAVVDLHARGLASLQPYQPHPSALHLHPPEEGSSSRHRCLFSRVLEEVVVLHLLHLVHLHR